MDAFEVDGLAVTAVADNEILLAEGYGVTSDGHAYQASTSCGLYSATKVLASLTYANLAGADRVDLDQPLSNYLNDAPESWRDIPFYRLLNHTSGITMAVNKPEFAELAANPDASNEDIYRLVQSAPLDYAPGEYSRYRQSGYAVGEWILWNELDATFDELVTEYITAPADMTSTTHPAVADPDQPNLILSAGGFETTANDMAKLFLGINRGDVIAADDWKALLLDPRYRFGDYSLGSTIETRNDVLTVGHSGGGARANIRYAPDHKVGVMVCTDDTDNHWLAITLARMLIDEITSGEPPLTPLLVALAGYATMTGDEIASAFKSAAAQADRYELAESEGLLNAIGYTLLEQARAQDAVIVFRLNSERFPDSPNTHDSLGEALLASGDKDAALSEYRKVLALDPGNANATAMIEKIEAGM